MIAEPNISFGRKWRFKHAMEYLGFDRTTRFTTEEDYQSVMAVWKSRLVEARRRDDEQEARLLSLCKQVIKKRYRSVIELVCECGRLKSRNTEHCQLCYNRIRFYDKSMTESVAKDYEIVSSVPVPPKKTGSGLLVDALRRLAKSQIGDSFVAQNCVESVRVQARFVGIEVTCRLIAKREKGKKPRTRVWRSDGYSDEKVNEIIAKRLKGETVPDPKTCIPVERPKKSKHR